MLLQDPCCPVLAGSIYDDTNRRLSSAQPRFLSRRIHPSSPQFGVDNSLLHSRTIPNTGLDLPGTFGSGEEQSSAAGGSHEQATMISRALAPGKLTAPGALTPSADNQPRPSYRHLRLERRCPATRRAGCFWRGGKHAWRGLGHDGSGRASPESARESDGRGSGGRRCGR